MDTNTMHLPTDLIDHAAMMSDRWAFFAALAVLGGVGYACLRYLANQLERSRADYTKLAETAVADRDRMVTVLTKLEDKLEHLDNK